ncbi:MAG: hypothetical protein Q7S42_01080 [Candidatus Omnitrophota bacterium]|nr:hypothetical protein [Candidatus Omnitrophota bacterium]
MVKAKAKKGVKRSVKKGAKLVCVPCGREAIISNFGVSGRTIWCCGKAMQGKKVKSSKKKK